MPPDLLNDPGSAIAAAIAVPFAARQLIAGFVLGRVWGLIPGQRRGVLRRDDFPSPNNWLREFVAFVAIFLAAFLVVPVLIEPLGLPRSPAWAALYLAVLFPTLVWLYRRMRADDRRALEIRRQRQAEVSLARFEEEAQRGRLW